MARSPVLPPVAGAWSYMSGIAGTATVPAGFRVLQITASAPASAAATVTINGGQTVTVPPGKNLTIEPKGNVTAPVILFAGTDAYFIELVR